MNQRLKFFHPFLFCLLFGGACSSPLLKKKWIFWSYSVINKKMNHSFILSFFHSFILSFFHSFILSFFHSFKPLKVSCTYLFIFIGVWPLCFLASACNGTSSQTTIPLETPDNRPDPSNDVEDPKKLRQKLNQVNDKIREQKSDYLDAGYDPNYEAALKAEDPAVVEYRTAYNKKVQERIKEEMRLRDQVFSINRHSKLGSLLGALGQLELNWIQLHTATERKDWEGSQQEVTDLEGSTATLKQAAEDQINIVVTEALQQLAYKKGTPKEEQKKFNEAEKRVRLNPRLNTSPEGQAYTAHLQKISQAQDLLKQKEQKYNDALREKSTVFTRTLEDTLAQRNGKDYTTSTEFLQLDGTSFFVDLMKIDQEMKALHIKRKVKGSDGDKELPDLKDKALDAAFSIPGTPTESQNGIEAQAIRWVQSKESSWQPGQALPVSLDPDSNSMDASLTEAEKQLLRILKLAEERNQLEQRLKSLQKR